MEVVDPCPVELSRLPPWDPKRWPKIPVPLGDRVVPTIASEGYDCMRVSEVVEPITHEGEVMVGTMFVGPDHLRRIRNAHGSYYCDVSGRQINKRTIFNTI